MYAPHRRDFTRNPTRAVVAPLRTGRAVLGRSARADRVGGGQRRGGESAGRQRVRPGSQAGKGASAGATTSGRFGPSAPYARTPPISNWNSRADDRMQTWNSSFAVSGRQRAPTRTRTTSQSRIGGPAWIHRSPPAGTTPCPAASTHSVESSGTVVEPSGTVTRNPPDRGVPVPYPLWLGHP